MGIVTRFALVAGVHDQKPSSDIAAKFVGMLVTSCTQSYLRWFYCHSSVPSIARDAKFVGHDGMVSVFAFIAAIDALSGEV